MFRLSDTSDRSSANPLFTLVLRAAFVPEGEQPPPPSFAADFSPLKFRATLDDPTTGVIICENAGMTFGGDIQAEWHPDENAGSRIDEASPDDDAQTKDQSRSPKGS